MAVKQPKLSTHVLDTYSGCPASGITWSLFFAGSNQPIASGATNADGRTDAPLLEGDDLKTGTYRLHFDVAGYYKAKGIELAEPPFLGIVIIQVNLIAGNSYHVPLLTSPWSYSTYRGS